jgi:hypothetical protein
LNEAVSAGDSLEAARATAAFKFHLDLHLAKEDSHLYRLIRERVSEPDQYKAIGIMAGSVPRERFPEAIAWLFPLPGSHDRENLMDVWQTLMPPEVFAGVKELVRGAVGDDQRPCDGSVRAKRPRLARLGNGQSGGFFLPPVIGYRTTGPPASTNRTSSSQLGSRSDRGGSLR